MLGQPSFGNFASCCGPCAHVFNQPDLGSTSTSHRRSTGEPMSFAIALEPKFVAARYRSCFAHCAIGSCLTCSGTIDSSLSHCLLPVSQRNFLAPFLFGVLTNAALLEAKDPVQSTTWPLFATSWIGLPLFAVQRSQANL